MTRRELGVAALKSVLTKQQNITTIEKNINSVSDTDEEYQSILYEVINDIISKISLKDILKNLKNKKIMWNHPCFQELQNKMDEQDQFNENPFEVEEGALQCHQCKSRRVFYYQRQLRSADEPMHTFATCCQCKARWVYSG